MLHSKFNKFDVHLVESVEELEIVRKVCAGGCDVGIDTETDGLDHYKHNIAGVCISGGKGYLPGQYHGFYLPVRHNGYTNNLPLVDVVKLTQELVDNYKTIWFNRDFDFCMLEKEGVQFPCPGNTHDAQCMAHLIKGDSFPSLKDFCQDYLHFDVIHYSDNNAEEGSFKTTDPSTSFIYAAGDPILTVLLARKLWAEYPYIRKIYPLDNKFAEVMRRVMYSTDLYLDHEMVDHMLEDNLKEQQIVKKEIFAMCGYQFRLSSNVDVADALSRFVTLTKKTKTGKIDVSKDVLKEIDHPLAKLIAKAKNLDKFRSTYLAKMKEFPQPFHINYQHCNVACLTENNLVRTTDGIKSIRDVQVGDMILNENRFSPVLDMAAFQDACYRVTLRNGAFIEGNAKHPVLVSTGVWKYIGDLTTNDRVVMCRRFHESVNVVELPSVDWSGCRKHYDFDRHVDIQLASLLGFIDGDGSLVSDGVKLCFSKFESEVEEYYVHLFASRFNMPVPSRHEGKDNTIQYKFCSVGLSRWLRSLGVKSHGSDPGVDISCWSSACQMAYVAALIDTDGSLVSQKSPDKFNIRLAMTSKAAIDNVAMALRFHGMDVHQWVTTKGRKQPLYELRVRSFTRYGLFADKVGCFMHCSHKLARLQGLTFDYNHPYNRWAGKEESSEVVSVEYVGCKTVYDIVVGVEHTFIANGIVTHNTGRLSSGGSKGNSFFAPFNIQNVPKIEVMRELHYAPVSSPIHWRLIDNPFKPLSADTPISTPDGFKPLSSLHEGDDVVTPLGIRKIISVGEYTGPLQLVALGALHVSEGVYIKKDGGEWSRIQSTSAVDDVRYFMDLGDACSICIPHGAVQTKSICHMKCKGGMRDAFVCPEPSALYTINGVDYEGDELVDGVPAKEHKDAVETIEPWVWLSADYCSQEMVLLANFSKEPVLLEPLLNGEDIHKFVATKMFGHYEKTMRSIAKAINFAANYGGTGFTIANKLGITPQEGEALLDKYNATLAHAFAWKQSMIKEGRRKGYVCTYFGRPRVVSMYYQSSNKGDWGFADRTCMNSPIQGCLPASTLIQTRYGLVPIVSFTCGDVWNGICWTYAERVDKGQAELVKITTKSGKVFECDNRHILKVADTDYHWAHISEIGPGTKLCVNNASDYSEEFDFWQFLLGYITGDGNMTERPRAHNGTRCEVTITFGAHEKRRACWIMSKLESGGFHVGMRYTKPSVLQLAVSSKVLVSWLKQLGMNPNTTATTKHVPDSTFAGDARSFIYGLYLSDGSKGKWPAFHMNNHDLLSDVALLLGQYGFVTGLHKTKNAWQLTVHANRHDFVRWLRTGKFNSYKVSESVPVEVAKRSASCFTGYPSTSSESAIWRKIQNGGSCSVKSLVTHGYSDELYATDEVVSVEYTGCVQSMYTLATDHPLHQFVTEGFISKNTGGDLIRRDYINYWNRCTSDHEWNIKTKHALTVHDEINLYVKPSYAAKAFQGLKDVMECQFSNWTMRLNVSPSVGLDWGSQIELKGYDEDGNAIVDADPEDLSLLG